MSGSGVLATLDNKVVGPLETSNNILDNGSGDATIAGALSVSQNLGVSGGLTASSVNSSGNTTVGGTLNVSGNSTLSGSLSTGNTTINGGYPFILYGGGLGAETLSSGAIAVWYSGVGIQSNATSATNANAFAIVSADAIEAVNITSSGNTTVAGGLKTKVNTLDDGSGNATISGALTTNISIPNGNTVALDAAISQISVNVNNFSSPQAAVDYVISQGGGEVFFPASATEYSGFVANYPYNLVI